MKITYLRKVGDDVISHCSCGDGRVTFPAQMDCPWCGCGWLFSCMTCRKAFTFAEGIELDASWEQLAAEDLKARWRKEASAQDIADWVEAMKIILKDVQIGTRYIILDGSVFPADSTNIDFEGWHSHHHFETFPHFTALDDRSFLDEFLGKRSYWEETKLPEVTED